MQKVSRQIFREFIWLTIFLVLTTALAFFLFGCNFLNSTFDIHLHDTYFVMAGLQILLPMFILVTFCVYFIKEFRNSFKRKFPNWILLISGLMLIISLTLLIKLFSQFFTGGVTLYPPLSALGPDKVPELTPEPVTQVITNIFTIIQFLILIMILFAVYRWGRQSGSEKRKMSRKEI